MSSLPSIAIIGAGSMGGAILGGLVAPTVTVDGGIRVTNRTEAKAATVRHEGVESFALETDADANLRAVRGARVVLVGVKPAMVRDTLIEIAPALEPDAIVVSVAAGVTTATMESVVPGSVIRAMPNTPALVGRAVTGLSHGSRSSDDDMALVRAVFETVGTVVEVPEAKIDALSTVSGSGPAYVFLLVEEFTRAAEGLGFSPEQASLLVSETFLGAMQLLAASDDTPEELRRKVTSPKGTTERAIAVLQEADLESLFARATAAALARAKELAAS
ncbi:pyrroline-5-carboxylate reductase [Microbacteriaceae bacterium SG_E_30_P1]|uniref:Pyrroline-5-carboxylate reductase n=1 Tax=Antiquaquibacter oligotrophicus TaxID=2880260 RepID=A0ABT6KQ05_9MICO|nr:pyrroline-5-carboxylate reductase [Antiquaquibacter oligotrophicus]MDH6182053.1 pyrroline-5-carboxylate reductase [Antiquaquibacter oligotrophicus]UDF12279.1 pyrroline-5-carboxylate reductase [Antiquaquibacter oligotrophicus]